MTRWLPSAAWIETRSGRGLGGGRETWCLALARQPNFKISRASLQQSGLTHCGLAECSLRHSPHWSPAGWTQR
eukprot:scaffold176640_cov20-Tisochrysis_lutea.AAC.1